MLMHVIGTHYSMETFETSLQKRKVREGVDLFFIPVLRAGGELRFPRSGSADPAQRAALSGGPLPPPGGGGGVAALHASQYSPEYVPPTAGNRQHSSEHVPPTTGASGKGP